MMTNNPLMVSQPSILSAYDILISACGYESRCINIPEAIGSKTNIKTYFKFADRQIHNYKENLKWFTDNEFQQYDFGKDFSVAFLKELIVSLPVIEGAIKIAIDYSSMDRKMIARLVHGLFCLIETYTLDIHFLYSPSTYSPSDKSEQFITVSEPVIPEYSGKLANPNLPTVAIAGIGYEYERTLGVLEYLEPARVKIYMPNGIDQRFDKEVKDLNFDLFDFLSSEDFISYDLLEPYELYKGVESICYGLLKWSRPVFIPLGPKPFTLVSLIVSSIFDYEPVVWRVSDDQNDVAMNRHATGDIITLGLSNKNI